MKAPREVKMGLVLEKDPFISLMSHRRILSPLLSISKSENSSSSLPQILIAVIRAVHFLPRILGLPFSTEILAYTPIKMTPC
jgi:hypothetical protein